MDYLTPIQRRVKLSDFKATLNADSFLLKDNIHRLNKQTEKTFIDDLVGKITKSLICFFKKDNPNVTDEQILAFIDVFMDFRLESEYDIRRKMYVVTVVPVWKPVNMIDFGKVEKLELF